MPFVRAVVDALAARTPHVLVLAAGGAADSRGLAASLMLGAPMACWWARDSGRRRKPLSRTQRRRRFLRRRETRLFAPMSMTSCDRDSGREATRSADADRIH
jgi:hypothetical protein